MSPSWEDAETVRIPRETVRELLGLGLGVEEAVPTAAALPVITSRPAEEGQEPGTFTEGWDDGEVTRPDLPAQPEPTLPGICARCLRPPRICDCPPGLGPATRPRTEDDPEDNA